MSGTKIHNLRNLFRETKHLKSFVRIHACVTQFLKIRAISSTAVFQVLAMQSVMRQYCVSMRSSLNTPVIFCGCRVVCVGMLEVLSVSSCH